MVSACMIAKILATDRCQHRQTEPLGTQPEREMNTRQLWWPRLAGSGNSRRSSGSYRSTERNLAPHQHHTLRLAKSLSRFRAPLGAIERKPATSLLSKDPTPLSVTRPAHFATAFEGGRKHEPARGLNATRLAIKISAIALCSTRNSAPLLETRARPAQPIPNAPSAQMRTTASQIGSASCSFKSPMAPGKQRPRQFPPTNHDTRRDATPPLDRRQVGCIQLPSFSLSTRRSSL